METNKTAHKIYTHGLVYIESLYNKIHIHTRLLMTNRFS